MNIPSLPPKRPVGRPAQEPTVRLRVPESHAPAVVAMLDARRAVQATAHDPRQISIDGPTVELVAFAHGVPAGFPSPADDYLEDVLDLNRHLIIKGHEEATHVMRVKGHSMRDAGILDGAEIMVDRAITPTEGRIVVAIVNGDFTIKRLVFRKGNPVLVAENPHFPDREFNEGEELQIWGVVTVALTKL